MPGPPYKEVLTMIRDRRSRRASGVREQNVIRGNYAPMSEPKYDDDNPILARPRKRSSRLTI